MIAIYQSLSDDRADLYSLVLTAAAIEHRVFRSWAGWTIAVWPEDAAAAAAAVDAYRRENPETDTLRGAAAVRGLRQASW